MHENFRKKLKELIKKLYEKELEEITTTGDVEGYSTPFAFSGNKKKKKKKIKEVLDRNDLTAITKLIRDVVADIIRDIWIKRTSWK